MYLDNDEYKKAVSAINKGLSRGGVKRPDSARLVLGMAYFNSQQYDKARDAFEAAAEDERSQEYAKQWISYMESELSRQKALQEEDAALQQMTEALTQPDTDEELEIEVPPEDVVNKKSD